MIHQSHDTQIARHIDLIFDSFLELHGDRRAGDDSTVIGGLARLGEHKVVVVGYQRANRAPNAEGYRKSSRLIRLAETFGKPVILFIGLSQPLSSSVSEQQADEAMSRNLEKMSRLMTPVIGVLMGESSGIAAIDMCAADRVLMLENASCCFPLSDAASEKCLGAQDLLSLNVADRIVEDVDMLKNAILGELHSLAKVPPKTLAQERLNRLQRQFMNF